MKNKIVPMTSVSTENLSSTKLQRVPSLPKTYNRNRSGIPVVNRDRDIDRDPPPPPPPRGLFILGDVTIEL